jgi:hypothetical protein
MDRVFDEELAAIEKDAWQVLDRAGLLTPKEEYQLPGTQGTWRGLIYRLEEHGYRNAIDEECFAARILTTSAGLREYVDERMQDTERDIKKRGLKGIFADRVRRKENVLKGLFVQAIYFGQLVKEAQIRFRYIKEQSRTGGVIRGERQTANRVSEWAKWQAAANEIWKKHPTWGKPAVAGMVQKQFPSATARTIRLRIKKPAP